MADVERRGPAGAKGGLPAAPGESLFTTQSTRQRGKGIAQSARLPRQATLVIASVLAGSRRRWSRTLGEAFVVCEVADRKTLEQIIADLKPDVAVVDLALPGLGGVGVVRSLRRLSPSTKILVVTNAPGDGEGAAALKSGVKGYCRRTIDPGRLKKAVEAIQSGKIWAPLKLLPGLIAELLSLVNGHEEAGPPKPDCISGLTARQRAVADLISQGAKNKEIASRLEISERTVKAHLTEVFRNVGVTDRLQLALLLKGYPPATG